MWEKRSRILFLSGLFTAALVFFQMGMYVLYGVMGWELHFNVFQLCKATIHSLGFSSAAYVIDALVFYTFAWAIGIVVRQLWLTRRFLAKLSERMDADESARLNGAYREGIDDILVVRCSDPLAFTIGFVRRRIVLSTGLLQLLNENELEAVIHHEAYHHKHADPFKVFVLSLFASVFWYLPILKHIHSNYKVIREVLADRHAVDQTGSIADLGRALLKLLKQRQAAPAMTVCHVSFADTAINYRIQRILDPKTEIPVFLPVKSVLLSISAILLLSQLFWVSLT